MEKTLFDFTVKGIDGSDVNLADYAGKVVLIVNVASKCGFTPQYADLQALYTRLGPKGFVVMGFPCNQFGDQEPGMNEEVLRFCRSTYGVEFPVFSKIEVNGPKADPVYKWLKSQTPESLDEEIAWNFTKFLVDRSGKPRSRYAPATVPGSIENDITRLLESLDA